MKYLYEEKSSSGKPYLTFALGHQEALILFGLLSKAKQYIPKTFETQFDCARIGAMIGTLVPLVPRLNRLDYTEAGTNRQPVPVSNHGITIREAEKST